MLENGIIKRTFNCYLILLIIAVVFTLAFHGFNDFLVSLILPIITLVLLSWFNERGQNLTERQFILSIFFWSLLMRVAAVYVMGWILTSYNGMPFISDKDDYLYNQASIAILERWKIEGPGFYDDIPFSSDTYSGFPNFSAALMSVFGPSLWVPRIGNAFMSSFTVVLGYLICKRYSNKQSSRFIGILLSFLPLTIVFSALQLKDTLLLFFTVFAIYSCINIIDGRSIVLSIVYLVISLIGISFGRPAVMVPIMAALVCVLLENVVFRNAGNRFFKVVVFCVVILLLLYAYQILDALGFESVDEYFASRYHKMSDIDLRDSMSSIKNLSIAKYLGAPLYIIGGFFLPPPLLVDVGESINYSSWAVLCHFAFLPFIVPALFLSFTQRKEYPIPFFLLLVFLFLRIGQANSLFTVFSPRQSLGTLFIMYLILPMYKKVNRHWHIVVMAIAILVMLAYNVVRLRSHGLF